jgi:hypothetical protein
MVEHAFRLAQDRSLRYQLAHDPFFHNWIASFRGYDLKRWSDGDDFLVNGIAHPVQGAIASSIYIQNSPMARTRVIGRDPEYWKSRMKGMAWATAYEVQWKIGPLSETSIGNAGGWKYVPGCGTDASCLVNPKNGPPTNNTGLSDWIVTPLVGTGWVIMEDTLDKYVVERVAEQHRVLGNILRTALEPCRSFAGGFAGVLPWDSASRERHLARLQLKSAGTFQKSANTFEDELSWKRNRRSVGVQFVNINLPGVKSDCVGCRENYFGIGFPYGFRIFNHVYFDSEFNYFPSGSSQSQPRSVSDIAFWPRPVHRFAGLVVELLRAGGKSAVDL